MFQKLAVAVVASLVVMAGEADANRLDNALKQLDPETRLIEVCAYGALQDFGRSDRYKRADRAVIEAASPAAIEGSTASGDGAAVRVGGHWFHFRYRCTATDDHMRVTDIDVEVGGEIPEEQWAELGLWD